MVHLHGTDEMSTSNVFSYFESYAPRNIEWINDSSCECCNVYVCECVSECVCVCVQVHHARIVSVVMCMCVSECVSECVCE